ncbi:MAG: GNAT family N-acetyltransferase [Alphaproteobacteria bacterium]|nr:GNAT family N-acetyltransferase [Alphaproteobacteria bacterium]
MPRLVLPDHVYAVSYIEALREGFVRGNDPVKGEEEIASIERDFAAFLAKLNDQEGLVRLPSGEWVKRVPGHEFWLVEGEEFIGEASIRYELNAFLLEHAGHIGYGVRPSMKRKGLGTLILKLALDKLKERGVMRALVTCDEDNIASMKIIESSGGVLENKVPSVFHEGSLTRRYWIDLG